MSPSKPQSTPDDPGVAAAWLAEPFAPQGPFGPARRAMLAALLGPAPRRRDALLALPRHLQTMTPTAGADLGGGPAAFVFRATASPRAMGRRGLALDGAVDDVPLRLLWFRRPPASLVQRLAHAPALLRGEVRAAARGALSCAHPRVLRAIDRGLTLADYAGLDRATSRLFQDEIRGLLEAWPGRAGAGLRAALAVVHGLAPGDPEAARRRLAAAEWHAFRTELAAAAGATVPAVRPFAVEGRLARALVRRLPFRPTPSQTEVHDRIRGDFVAGRARTRLVNGDVGSGKTLVAALAAADAIESGRQTLVLAPSESLARQHAQTLDGWFRPLGVDVALLTGSLPARARPPLLARLAAGALPLVVGTHALLEDTVRFADLGLAVIDEQQRFGVRQRSLLSGKGLAVHLMMLTATPIPRTLALMLDGSIEVSRLAPRPATGANVETRAIGLDRLPELEARVEAAIAEGARIFWVCPSIDGGDGLAGTRERYARFAGRISGRVACVTGRMDAAARDDELAAFRSGARPLLIATTVIEVGIDVADASIIVVEQAERFGLAQLHQLRGRVGRGGQPASCVLLHTVPLGATQRRRLDFLRRSHDGLALAEADLEARGGGDLLGLRQSGAAGFRVFDPVADANWLAAATAEDLGLDPRHLFATQATGTGGLAAG